MSVPIHELKLNQMVEVKVSHAPYQVINIEDNVITFAGKDGVFSDTSGYARVVDAPLPEIRFFKNARGIVHIHIGDTPLCGYRASDITEVRGVEPTCQHCRNLLKD